MKYVKWFFHTQVSLSIGLLCGLFVVTLNLLVNYLYLVQAKFDYVSFVLFFPTAISLLRRD